MYAVGQRIEVRSLITSGAKRLGNYHEHYEWLECIVVGTARDGRIRYRLKDCEAYGKAKPEDVRVSK